MASRSLFLYDFHGVMDMDYIEIMDFCGYDLEKANELAKEEILREAGLEKLYVEVLESESD